MKKKLFRGIFKMMNTLLKKSIFLFLLFLLLHLTGFSQGIYSEENLRQASMEELNAYLEESQVLKTTGTILSVAGPAALIAGSIAFSIAVDDGEMYGSDASGYLILGGLVTTLIGVPILILASSRVKRITGIMEGRSVSFEIAPGSFHTLYVHNPQPGITLRMKF
jgi:hypothetical protein